MRARKVIFVAAKESWISEAICRHCLKLLQSQGNLKCHPEGHHCHRYHPPCVCQREVPPPQAENAAPNGSTTIQDWKQRIWFPN